MSSSEADVGKIKRSILLRYPYTTWEEISRALIMFKTYRGNRKLFRALPIMDELIDYCNIDPISGKHFYEMNEDEKKSLKYELIDLPQNLVRQFKVLYHGTEDDYDGEIGIKHLAPGTSADPSRPTVFIRKPMRFLDAYGDHPAAWIAFIAGVSYQVVEMTPSGFPSTKIIPMVDMSSEDIEHTYSHEIPYIIWSTLLERIWKDIAPVCTRLERVIVKALADRGITEGSMQSEEISDGESEENNLML